MLVQEFQQDFTDDCRGLPKNITITLFYRFRDGLPLMLFDDTMVSTEYGEVIEVRRAMQTQSGNYTCVARNKIGNTSVNYLLDVLGKKIIKKHMLQLNR